MKRVGHGLANNILPTPFKLRTAQNVLALLWEQIEAVKIDTESGVLEKARCIGYLCGISLKAVETAEIETRLDILERKISLRSVG
jgi:hypothetical protein